MPFAETLKTELGIKGGENEARMVAIYPGRHLGGHKHEEIGKAVEIENASSVSSA